jgi:hypothetical protein
MPKLMSGYLRVTFREWYHIVIEANQKGGLSS